MGHYRVKAGKHAVRMATGKLMTWKKGEVVQSESDLTLRFPEKFEKVHLEEVSAKGAVDRAYTLREKVKNSRTEDPPNPPAPEEDDDDLPPEPEEEEEKPDYGTDVTAKFQMIEADGRLAVKYDGDNYTILQGEETVAGPLDQKRAVVEWFTKWKKTNKKK